MFFCYYVVILLLFLQSIPTVHLRERKLKDGVIGFYLDFYVGGSRYYETLDIKIRPEYAKDVKKTLRDKATSILYSKRSDILVKKHPEVFKKCMTSA